MNKIMKNTAIMLVTLNLFSVTALAVDSTSPVFPKNAGNIPTIYNLDKSYVKDQGKTAEDFVNKYNPKGNKGLMGFVQNRIASISYGLGTQADKIDTWNVALTKSFGKKNSTTDVIVERVDGDGIPLVITKVTNHPTTLEHNLLVKGDSVFGSDKVYDKFYETVILDGKYSQTKPPTVQQTLAINSKSEKTLGLELAKKDPLMKDFLDSKGLSYKLSTDKVIINTVNNQKANAVAGKNVEMAKETALANSRSVENEMMARYNSNLALIKPVVKHNIPTTAAGLTKVDKYKTMTPTVQGFAFKMATPTLNKDAQMKEFVSGLNLEGNELMKKAVENFQGLSKP